MLSTVNIMQTVYEKRFINLHSTVEPLVLDWPVKKKRKNRLKDYLSDVPLSVLACTSVGQAGCCLLHVFATTLQRKYTYLILANIKNE